MTQPDREQNSGSWVYNRSEETGLEGRGQDIMSKEFVACVSNAVRRRTFLKLSLGVCTAGTMIGPGLAQARVVPYYKAIFDERFGDPCAFATGAEERCIPTVAIRGDVTKLFFDHLDLRWKQGPVLLAGYTTPASLFCLDLLARDRGMRVRHCVAKPGVEAALGVLDGALPGQGTTQLLSSDPSVLVFWIIAPNARASAEETGNA